MIRSFLFLLLSFISTGVMAQLCQGSLGDPIVNITFGAGSNPGAPLMSAATGYSYVNSDCPSDGSYTVRNSTAACFGNSWYTIPSDHTGDPNGYFMLVNASIDPKDFYVEQINGLCGNSTYEFAAWIANVILPGSCGNASIQPNLTFTIERTDGTILKTYNTGNIPPTNSPTWTQYGFFFTTPPAGSNIVVRIKNNAPGGCGNDLALDDITFRPCGPQLTPGITGEPGPVANICEGTARNYNFTCTVSGGFLAPVFQWQQRYNNGAWTDIAGQTTTTLTRSFLTTTAAGIYQYRLNVAETGNMGSAACRISSQPITVNVNANPVATASSNSPLCAGTNLSLTATGGTVYNWSGPGGYAATGTPAARNNIQPSQAGVYNVIVTNAAGCKTTTNTTVVVNALPVASVASPTASICTLDSVQLSVSGGVSYEWQPAQGLSSKVIANPKASPAATTKYLAIVTNAAGCKDTATVDVTVFEKAFANAGPDKFLVEGQTVNLSGSIAGSYLRFNWSPTQFLGNPQSLQSSVTPTTDMTYTLTVESNNGCGISTDVVDVKFYKGIYIPSAFTPNGDAINPTWNIPALNAFPGFELSVFNRYGQVVFQTRNANIAWNGKFKGEDVPAGAYTYVIDLKKAPGILKGTVMVLR